MKLLLVAVVAVGSVCAQQGDSRSQYSGQTWVGLLVTGSCPAGSKHHAATDEANRTVSDRVTTPGVDNAGTRGSSEQSTPEPGARGDVPQTGDVNMRGKGEIQDPGWQKARRQAASLDAACRVTTGTRAFSLMLPDGTVMRFDDLANTKIIELLEQRGLAAGAGKVLRVQVIGKVENGSIALDQIKM